MDKIASSRLQPVHFLCNISYISPYLKLTEIRLFSLITNHPFVLTFPKRKSRNSFLARNNYFFIYVTQNLIQLYFMNILALKKPSEYPMSIFVKNKHILFVRRQIFKNIKYPFMVKMTFRKSCKKLDKLYLNYNDMTFILLLKLGVVYWHKTNKYIFQSTSFIPVYLKCIEDTPFFLSK